MTRLIWHVGVPKRRKGEKQSFFLFMVNFVEKNFKVGDCFIVQSRYGWYIIEVISAKKKGRTEGNFHYVFPKYAITGKIYISKAYLSTEEVLYKIDKSDYKLIERTLRYKRALLSAGLYFSARTRKKLSLGDMRVDGDGGVYVVDQLGDNDLAVCHKRGEVNHSLLPFAKINPNLDANETIACSELSEFKCISKATAKKFDKELSMMCDDIRILIDDILESETTEVINLNRAI